MSKQVYVIPFECVQHLYDGDTHTFTDRDKVKKVGTKCGKILTVSEFEKEFNEMQVDTEDNVILFD